MVRLNSDDTFARYDSCTQYNAIGVLYCTNDPASLPASAGVAQKSNDDDGSVWLGGLTMVFDNQNVRISNQTDLNVVCQRFGYTAYVANSEKDSPTPSSETMVRLGSDRRFSQYESGRNFNAIGELICR